MSKLGKMFQRVVNIKRGEVIAWLCSKYSKLAREDSEDIVQESSFVLWNMLEANKVAMVERDLVNMWKAISRNKYTHWVNKQVQKETWDDRRLQYDWEERDYGWERGNEAQRNKMEAMFDWIDRQTEKNRLLIQMVLADKSMNEISKALALKSDQNARNKKCNLVKRMKKELNNGQTYVACPLSVYEVA